MDPIQLILLVVYMVLSFDSCIALIDLVLSFFRKKFLTPFILKWYFVLIQNNNCNSKVAIVELDYKNAKNNNICL